MSEFFDTIADVGSDEEEDEDFDGDAGDGEPRPKKTNGTNGIDDSSEEEDDDDEDRLRQASLDTTGRSMEKLTGA
jgi:transcription elongation factor SPT6